MIFNLHKELKMAQAKDNSDKNEIRRKEQEKLYWYYSGDNHNILRCLDKALGITYDEDDIAEMQKQWVNLTEKFINQLSVVYQDPAQRKLVNKNGVTDEDATKYYLSILPDNINSEDKLAHRLGKLQNTIFTQVIADKNKIRYKTMPSHLYNVKTDEEDPHLITQISYDKYYDDEIYTIVWEPNRHYMYDANENMMNVKNRGDKENPFGLIPFSKLIMKKGIDIWGEGQSDILNVNEQINFLLTKLVNSDIILGTEGTTLGINLGFTKKGTTDEGGVRKIRTGRKHPITVENVKSDEAQPGLQHITTDPHIEDIMAFIDRYITITANLKGLEPKSFLSVVKDTSDYQTLMGMVTQIEVRRDDIEPLRIYEKERFNITRIVNNYYADVKGYEFKKIPDDLELDIDFADVAQYKTTADIWADRAEREARNMGSAIDWLKEDNPDLTDDEAKEILDKNKGINTTSGSNKQPSLVETLLGNNLTKKENVND